MYKVPVSTLFLGKNLVILPECPSTNTAAGELSQNASIPEGTVVITDQQTEGRGQRGNRWLGEPGMNLTFSIVFKPTFLMAQDQFLLNQVVSLGVRDALAPTHEVLIKWPNDIMIKNKKAGGILIENQVNGTFLRQSIVGIGLNVNQVEFDFPAVTSLRAATGEFINLNEMLAKIMKGIEVRYLQLRSNDKDVILRDYHQKLFWRDEEHSFSSAGKTFEGVITGIDNLGRLTVKSGETTRAFGLKEITFLYE